MLLRCSTRGVTKTANMERTTLKMADKGNNVILFRQIKTKNVPLYFLRMQTVKIHVKAKKHRQIAPSAHKAFWRKSMPLVEQRLPSYESSPIGAFFSQRSWRKWYISSVTETWKYRACNMRRTSTDKAKLVFLVHRPVTSLGHQGLRRVFWGPKFLNYVQ